MSEITNASYEEVEETAPKPVNRIFHLKIEFAEEGVSMNVSTNLTPLEQLGVIELWKTNVLDELTGKKSQEDQA